MKQQKKKLLNWILDFEENSHIFAEKYGSFSLARMDFNVFISDDEFDKFSEAEQIMLKNDGIAPNKDIEANYYRYIQAHNHELFHYYQALSLPAFQIYQQITKNKTEHEASIMLRYFEQGYNYTLGENKNVLEALKNKDFKLANTDEKKIFDTIEKFKFFVDQWTAEYKNISLFHIIEGMAHIMSIQLTPNTTNYLKGTENNSIYNQAYSVFEDYIEDDFKDMDIRVKHLSFLYICYFSCQTYSLFNNNIIDKTARLFHLLSSRINEYYKTFEKLKKIYSKYSETYLRDLLENFAITKKDIKEATKIQLIYIYTFYELISLIENDAKKFYNIKLKVSIHKEFLEVFNSLNIDLLSKYQLANFALFPARMADLWEGYDIIQKLSIENREFDIAGESGFFELIDNCKNILKDNVSTITCCEEHGNTNTKLEVLYCENEGGFSFYLKELTNRKAIDLFRV